MKEITLTDPLDMHLHLREGEMLKNVLDFSASQFRAALVMPNLSTPITNISLAKDYEKEILECLKDSLFTPIMTLYISDLLSQRDLQEARESGLKVLKLYPKGATTNSQSGLNEILSSHTLKLFEIAQDLDFILSIHGESGGFSMDREYEFGKVFESLAKKFPKLKIIIEHMSDHRSIRLLKDYENIYATLTLHHITMDLDDVLGKGLNPHHFCKPILKTPKDKEELLDLALNANSKVSFGSDSAPHLEKNKLKESGAAGIFSAPNLLSSLVELFEKYNCLENLQKFVSDNAKNNYDLKFPTEKKITFIKKPSLIPIQIDFNQNSIIPLRAGETIEWSQIS